MTVMSHQPSSIPSLSHEQWREDLHVFAQQLVQRHKNPYHLISQAAFAQAVAALDAQIPVLKDYEIVVGIERLAAMIGDGHTRLDTTGLYHALPFEAFWFGRSLRVVRTTPAYQRALGAQIVAVEQHPLHAVQKRLQDLIPQAENRWYTLHESASRLLSVERLAARGIVPHLGDVHITVRDDLRNTTTLPMTPLSPASPVTWTEVTTPLPLFAQRRDTAFWFTTLPESHTVYVHFRGYQAIEEHAKKLWAYVDDYAPERLVIDMRHNRGGNYTLGREHLVYEAQFRRAINCKGHLFVITGRATFSAAMTNVIDFRRETDAILVGEPVGARPNGYQELDQFQLPNSHLQVYCSMFSYRFQDNQRPTVLPDMRIDPDWARYKAGRDPVLEWICNYSHK